MYKTLLIKFSKRYMFVGINESSTGNNEPDNSLAGVNRTQL